MRFRIVATSEAGADALQIALYLNSHSPTGARAWLDAYDRATELLAETADGCPVADEAVFLDSDVRQSSFKTRRGKRYRLVFTIEGDEVRILRVRGPGQSAIDPSDT